METTLTKIKSSYTALKGEFGYVNVMQAPKVEKIVVSIGTGRVQDKQKEALIRDRLALITGQKPSPRPAKQSIASRKPVIIGRSRRHRRQTWFRQRPERQGDEECA